MGGDKAGFLQEKGLLHSLKGSQRKIRQVCEEMVRKTARREKGERRENRRHKSRPWGFRRGEIYNLGKKEAKKLEVHPKEALKKDGKRMANI